MIPNVLTLQQLLHYYAMACPWDHKSQADTVAQRWLMNEQLIKSSTDGGSGFEVTEKGRALIRHIMMTPMPEQRWEVPPHRKPE